MKIGSFDNHTKPVGPAAPGSPTAPVGGHPLGTPAAQAAPSVAVPDASAKVALSPAASGLVNDGNSEFDSEKVARITQAIRDGRFHVNAEAIAARLIDDTQELLAGQRH